LDEAKGSRLEAARRIGVGRTTMYRWIKAGLLDQPIESIQARYRPRPTKPAKLERFKPLIQARLTEYPYLSGVRILKEIRAAGYAGGVTQLRAYVATLRPEPEPLVRFETPAGQQAQVDFAECRFPWGKRHALMTVLGYSRLLWVRFYPRQTLQTLILGLETCFASWGGVPEHLLFDQMKSVITRDERLTGGGLTKNLEFLRFARHYGLGIRACRPYRAKTKGKVERPIRYLRDSFLYGRTFLSDADVNAQVLDWLATVANPRVHATTREQPIERFRASEQPTLRPLPPRPYRAVVLPDDRAARPTRAVAPVPAVQVERRSLDAYAQLTAAGGDA
jgi:transposase